MFKRIILIIIFSLSFNILAQPIPHPPANYSYCDNHPRVPALNTSDYTAGMNFINNGSYRTPQAALAAASLSGLILSDEDLCYFFAPKWGSDKKKTLTGGSVVRYLEKGQRVGGCRIELYGDLSYKASYPNPLRSSETRNIRVRNIGRDWPMLDCSKVPPVCDNDFTPMRISNFIQNTTDVGLVAGDKTIIVQQWSCIKI